MNSLECKWKAFDLKVNQRFPKNYSSATSAQSPQAAYYSFLGEHL